MSDHIQSFDDSVLRTFSTTFASLKEQGKLTSIMSLDDLRASVSPEQRRVVDQIANLNPRDYGVNTPYAGDLEPVPDDLVQLTGQQFREDGELKSFGEQYVPRHVFDAYQRMNGAFMAEYPGRKLLIASCYRSPAYQVVVFINWLVGSYSADIARTIRHASPPNFSQHTIASRVAIDFANVDGSPHDENLDDFRDTVEYSWLRQHANDFGFYESWQAGNEFGMRAEPWHWQFRGARKSRDS